MKNLAFIDIEATGANPERAEIIELAFLVKNRKGEIVDHFHSLIKPAVPIPPEIVKLTGITDRLVDKAPEFNAVADKVFEKLKDAKLVAHKADFDRRVLLTKFARLGINYDPPSCCTLELARKTVPGMKSHSLAALCGFFRIPLKRNHRAQDDAEATADLYEILFALSGEAKTKNEKRRLPEHKKLIARARRAPGVITFKDARGNVLQTRPTENIRKELEDRLELKADNRSLPAKRLKVEIRETGSYARAMIIAAQEGSRPKWSVYSFKNKKGEIVARCGKARPDKRALFYFHEKRSAVKALKEINKCAGADKYAYREDSKADKSEILKKNALIQSRIRKMKPELEDILIRSVSKVNGRYQYAYIAGRSRLALFEREEIIENKEQLQRYSFRFKKLGPSTRRALELSILTARNQRTKTDVVVKLKRFSRAHATLRK